MSLVIFTALTGLLLAPQHVNPVIGFASLLAIAVGAGASGALNMWYDADIDAVMQRTCRRPIPDRQDDATRRRSAFGLILVVLSVFTSASSPIGSPPRCSPSRSSSMSSSIRCG